MFVQLPPGLDRVAVAYSGGRDSTALLHAVACAAQARGDVEVLALHVHHGLSMHADAWLQHALDTCRQWREQGLPVRLLVRRVQVQVSSGESVEARAREARYAALTDMAREACCAAVLLAHHQRDQAETLLLQALRGAGVQGLAAMPREVVRDGLTWLRPWLGVAREDIEAYLQQQHLSFIDDDSNGDPRFARNRLRLAVWPALVAAFPQADASLAAAAGRLADVLPGVAAWRAQLLAGILHGEVAEQGLDARKWGELSGPARRESLAHWYRQVWGKTLSASWLMRLAHEVPALTFQGRSASWAPVGLGLYRGVLRRAVVDGQNERAPVAVPVQVSLRAPGEHLVPGWKGRLRVTEVAQGGVSPALLAELQARPREGGEQFQLGLHRPARSLKKQYQAMAVPSWQRCGPLLWLESRLLFVPGLGLDARSLAQDGEPQWALVWVPDAH